VRWSPDGRLLTTASDDGTVRVIDTRAPSTSSSTVSKLTCDVGLPLRADFNPCGGRSYVGVATNKRAFLLYDVRAPTKLVQSYLNLTDEDASSVTSFAFHVSGDFAVTGGSDAKIKVLDLVEGRPIVTLLGPRTAVSDVAFNKDGGCRSRFKGRWGN